MKRTISHALVLTGFALGLPFCTLAATSQQLIDTLDKQATTKPMAMDGTLDFSLTERAVVKGTELTTGSATFRLIQRVVPTSVTSSDSEGRLAMEKGTVKTSTQPAVTLDGSISIQWKYVGGTVYFRVENLPPMLRAMLNAEGVNIEQYVGTWFRLDAAVLNELKSMGANTATATDVNGLMAQLKIYGVKQPFLAQWVEKRSKDKNGDSIVRIRARLNPRLMYAFLQAELKKINPKALDRAQQIKDVYAQYAKIVNVTRRMTFVFVVNETKHSLARLEMGGTFSQPRQTCTLNKAFNAVCRTVAIQTVRILAGFSINADSGAAVEAPSSSMTLEELMNQLQSQSSSTVMIDGNTATGTNPGNATMTQTLVGV